MPKKNIYIVSHAGGSPYHGPNMRSYYLAKKMLEYGHSVNIVSSSYFHKYYKLPKVEKSVTLEEIDGVKYRWIKTLKYPKRNYKQILNQFDFAYKLWKFRKSIFDKNADVVIFSSPPPISFLALIFIKKNIGFPVIFEARDIWPMGILGIGKVSSRHPYVKLLSFIEKMAYKYAEAIVSVKKGDVNYFEKNFPDITHKYHYIPNGYYSNGINKKKTIVKNSHNESIFGYIGAMSNVYNLDLILDAAKVLQNENVNAKFILVGGGEDQERLKIKKHKLNLNHVEFIGNIPKNEVMSYLINFDIAIISLQSTPAYKYGVSANKMFEYMYAKKPILAIYDTDFDDVEDAECGITLRNPNTKQLVEKMKELIAMEEQALLEMGNKGYQYYLQHYTFDIIGKKYEALIQKLT